MKRQDRQRHSEKLCLESLSIAFEEFPLAGFLKYVAYPPPYPLSARANRPARLVRVIALAKIGWKDRTTAKRSAESLSATGEYRRWIGKYEPNATELTRQRSQRLGRNPKISIVVPVYNPPAAFLEAMIDSVRAQTYANWELCLADGASSAEHVRPILEEARASDSRIKVVRCPENGGISAASNAALELATGRYIALLDHDDEIAERIQDGIEICGDIRRSCRPCHRIGAREHGPARAHGNERGAAA